MSEDYKKDENVIGWGSIWLKEGHYGKYMSGNATFPYNNHPITVRFSIIKNRKQEEGRNQPDYKMKVFDAAPAKPYEKKEKETEQKDGVPF